MKINLPTNYHSTDHDEDEYMNESQKESFRRKLQLMKEELLQQKRDYKINSEALEPDVNSDQIDLATKQLSDDITLKTMNRYSKLIKEIDEALNRINDDTYGYCEKSGEKIGIKRLQADPTTRLCIEEQEKQDKEEQTHKLREE